MMASKIFLKYDLIFQMVDKSDWCFLIICFFFFFFGNFMEFLFCFYTQWKMNKIRVNPVRNKQVIESIKLLFFFCVVFYFFVHLFLELFRSNYLVKFMFFFFCFRQVSLMSTDWWWNFLWRLWSLMNFR